MILSRATTTDPLDRADFALLRRLIREEQRRFRTHETRLNIEPALLDAVLSKLNRIEVLGRTA